MRLLFIFFSMLLYSFIWSQDVVKKEVSKEVSVTVDDDGQKERKMKIIIKTDDGEEKVLEWMDDGDTPDAIQKQLKEIDPGSILRLSVDTDDVENRPGVTVTYNDDMPLGKKHIKMRRGKKASRPYFWLDLNDSSQDIDLSDAYIGAQIRSVDDGGVEVLELIKDGPADNAKLEKGDVIQRINGARTRTMEGMLQLLNYYEPNDHIEMIISRDGKEKKVKMTLGKRPDYYKM